MTDFSQEVADIIEALDDPTPLAVYQAVDQFDGDYVAAAAGSLAANAGGGSQPGAMRFLKCAFTFDTTGILTGLPVYTPTPGDISCGFGISITTAFDGTTPTVYAVFQDELATPTAEAFAEADATQIDANHDSAGNIKTMVTLATVSTELFATTVPVCLLLTDGADGDPNDPTPMTQGEGVLYIGVCSAEDIS